MAAFLIGIAALFSPHVLLALGLCFAAGALRLVSPRRPPLERGVLAVSLVGLGIATWLMATIIGPLPATYTALHDGPVGDPAARMLMLFLALPATGFLTVCWLRPSVVVLLGEIGPEVLPAGVTLWQGIAMPALLVGTGLCVYRRRFEQAAALAGTFGLWSGRIMGGAGGALLLLGSMGYAAPARFHDGGWRLLHRIVLVAGCILTVWGSLGAQFVYSVLLGGMMLVAMSRR